MSKPEIECAFMYIVEKRTRSKSKMVPIEDVIFYQNSIEFEFEDGSTLPYDDFLFFQEDYEVVIRVRGVNYYAENEEEDYE